MERMSDNDETQRIIERCGTMPPPSARRASARLPHDLSVSPRPAPAPDTRKITPRGHPVPQLVQIVFQPLLEQANADRVHARRPIIGPDLLPRLINEALADLKRLHFRPGPGPGLLPWRVGPGLTLVCTAPSLQPHYRTFTATTGRPVPVPRIGTLPLAVSAACGPPSPGHQGTIAHLCPAVPGRQVLLFHASARNELTPPLHRTPPGQHAGHPLAEGTPPRRAFVPGVLSAPGFDVIVPPIDASAVVHTRSSSRRTPDPLTAGLIPQRSPPRLLTGAACGGLGSPPARRTRRAKPPSLAQHGSCWRPSTSPSLPFQDTPQNDGQLRDCRLLTRWFGLWCECYALRCCVCGEVGQGGELGRRGLDGVAGAFKQWLDLPFGCGDGAFGDTE